MERLWSALRNRFHADVVPHLFQTSHSFLLRLLVLVYLLDRYGCVLNFPNPLLLLRRVHLIRVDEFAAFAIPALAAGVVPATRGCYPLARRALDVVALQLLTTLWALELHCHDGGWVKLLIKEGVTQKQLGTFITEKAMESDVHNRPHCDTHSNMGMKNVSVSFTE